VVELEGIEPTTS